MLLSERRPRVTSDSGRLAVRLVTRPISEREVFSTLMASHPTVFVLANDRGFSAKAWLEMRPQDFSIPDWDEPVRWLQLSVPALGSVFTNFIPNGDIVAPQIADKLPLPEVFPAEPSSVPLVSTFHLRGPVASRALKADLPIPVWQTNDVLRSSEVEINVDGGGNVILARLRSRSGLTTADDKAIELTRQLTFKPVNHGAESTNLVAGVVRFDWVTVAAPNVPNEFE